MFVLPIRVVQPLIPDLQGDKAAPSQRVVFQIIDGIQTIFLFLHDDVFEFFPEDGFHGCLIFFGNIDVVRHKPAKHVTREAFQNIVLSGRHERFHTVVATFIAPLKLLQRLKP